MQINSINYNFKNINFKKAKKAPTNINFKGYYDSHVFAYDDMVSTQRRAFIRKHLEENPYCFIKDETDEYDKVINEANRILSFKKSGEYKKFLENDVDEIEKGIYRCRVADDTIKMFKYLGVDRVISLSPCLANKKGMEKQGLEYVPSMLVNRPFVLMPEYLSKHEYLEQWYCEQDFNINPIEYEEAKKQALKEFDAISKKYIKNEVIPFIKTMQKGNLVVGCDWGTSRTNNAIIFNSWFNVKCKNKFLEPVTSFDLDSFQNLYEKFTKKDKKELGFDKEHEKAFYDAIDNMRDTIG